MKRFFILILAILAVFACTAKLEPDVTPEPDAQAEIPVESVVLNVHELSLQPGEKANLTGRVYPDNADVKSVSWSSSCKEVAAVSRDGEVSAIGEGEYLITVDCDGKKDECKVTVSIVKVPVTSVSLDKPDASLLVGETVQLAATVLPVDATDKTVIWTTTNADVATVEDGLVSAIAAGETLLLGNHDLHYLDGDLGGSRYDYIHGARNKKFILDNLSLFQMAYETEVAGKKYLFSHAGVMWGWLVANRHLLGAIQPEEVCAKLNGFLQDRESWPKFFTALGDVSHSRWGSSMYGSMIWSDVDDWDDTISELPDVYQIFSHTQQEEDPVIGRNFACLDCRRAFRLTENGTIELF